MLSNRAITQRVTVMKPKPRLLLFLFVSHSSLNSSVTPLPYNTSAGACISAVHINFSVLMIVMWMPEAETEHNCTSKWLLPVGCSVSVFVCMFVCQCFFPSICSYCLHTPLRYLCRRLLYFCRMNVCTVQGAALCEMLDFKIVAFFIFNLPLR